MFLRCDCFAGSYSGCQFVTSAADVAHFDAEAVVAVYLAVFVVVGAVITAVVTVDVTGDRFGLTVTAVVFFSLVDHAI